MTEQEELTRAKQAAEMLANSLNRLYLGRIGLPMPPQGRSLEHRATVHVFDELRTSARTLMEAIHALEYTEPKHEKA